MDNLSFGAFVVKTLADYNRAKAESDRMYESIRKRNTDVLNISKNLGISYERISIVKQYIFFGQHGLGDENIGRFPSDLDMAKSWLRLSEANRGHNKKFLEHDIILIKHELLEIETLIKTGCTQAEAHNRAEKVYNYSLAVKEYYKRLKKQFNAGVVHRLVRQTSNLDRWVRLPSSAPSRKGRQLCPLGLKQNEE